jgi:hypothetical protein
MLFLKGFQAIFMAGLDLLAGLDYYGNLGIASIPSWRKLSGDRA